MHKRLRHFSASRIQRFLLPALLLLCSAVFAQTGGETGFENNSATAWTPGGSSESVSITGTAANVRTGAYALSFSTSASGSNKYWYTNSMYGSSASGTYVHFIYWALGTDNVTSMDASMRYTSAAPPSGAGSTANGTTAAINAGGWTRISYAAGNSNNRHYFPAPRRTSGNATTVYVDDLVMYTSSSNVTDLTGPGTPSAASGTVSGTNVTLGWTSNTDAGTGVQATLILRTTNLSAAAPSLNPQAVYSTTGGAAGPDTEGPWQVISTTTGATATSFVNSGVASGTYKYAIVLRDLAYNYSTAAVTAAITVGTASPTITITPGSFTGTFGNTVASTASTAQSYTVAGSALTANISIAAPTGFEISTSAATGYGASLSLVQSGGTVSATTIYARYAPGAASGATGPQNILHASTGATSQNLAVSGNALAAEPTSNGTIGASPVNATTATLNLSAGNGGRRIIVVRQGSAVSFTPADGTAPTGVNGDFSLASDQGGGNKIVYDGTGSGTALMTLTGLTAGMTYHASVFEYNIGTGTSQNFLTSTPANTSFTTPVPTPTITLVSTGFNSAFGNVVSGTSAAAQSYTVAGTNLTAPVTITAPPAFEVSLSASTGFGTSLSLTPTAGSLAATTVYVRFAPTTASGFTGSVSVSHGSTGATTQHLSVSGNAIASEPTAAGAISFGTPGTTSVSVNFPTTGNGNARILVVKQGIATTWTPADGVAVTGVNADFTLATDQGGANKVVYDGPGSGTGVVTVTGLTAGTTYYFSVYEYNLGTGTSHNYLLSPAASGNVSTAGLPSPAITVNTTGFSGAFGNVVAGTASVAQQYSVSAANLTANLGIAAPAGFEISLSPGTGFSGAIAIPPTAGAIPATNVYVRYAPAAASGATGALTILHTSTGAAQQQVTVSGNAIAAEPTAAGTINTGAATGNSLVLNLPTIGNGSKRIIVARQGAAVSYQPLDGAPQTGVNADFSVATDQGSGNKVVYDGSGSGSGVVTVTGLTATTGYQFAVYEYNEGTGSSQNYLLSPAATASGLTNTPAITLNQAGFSATFGNTVAGSVSAVQSYQLGGSNLVGNVTLSAPAGFEISLSATSGFASSLSVTPVAGVIASTSIYVRYAPAAASGATGTLLITHSSTGAATQNVSVSGNALATEPTTAGTIGFGTRGSTSIVINLPTIGNGGKRIIVARQSASVSFVPADGVALSGVNANFSSATDQGGGNKIVYTGAGSGSGVVTVTGLSAATNYSFSVYEFNEGTGSSQNYLLSPHAADTASTLSPVIVITNGAFTGLFGMVVTGTNSAAQSFTLSGANLTGNITLSAPAGFQISLAATSGYTSTLSLTQTAGTVSATTIYVRFAPTSASGATGSLSITASSAAAAPKTVSVSGTAIAAEPTTSGTLTITGITTNSATLNLLTVGNGNRRLIFCRPVLNPALTPADGTSYGGVNSNFTLATDHGSANKVVYDGTGSGSGLVTVTGLTSGTTYRFTVYEYNIGTGNSENYRTAPVASDIAAIRVPVPTIIVSTTGFAGAFGNVIIGNASGVTAYSVSGSNLADSLIVQSPAGFNISLSAGSGFTQRLALPQSNGTVGATQVYVRFAPILAAGSTGTLFVINSSAGATAQTVQVTGVALAKRPAGAGSISFGDVDTDMISIHLPTVGDGSRRLIVANAGSPAGFVPADANGYSGVASDYSIAASQTGGGKIVYDGSGSGNDVVRVTGLSVNTLYYFTVYEYNVGTSNSHCYLTSPAASSNMTTYDPRTPPTRIKGAAVVPFRIYPNPATTAINIEAPIPVRVSVLDAAGRLLTQTTGNRIDLSNVPAGIIIVQVSDLTGRALGLQKILVRH